MESCTALGRTGVHDQTFVICSRGDHPTPLEQIGSEKALQELALIWRSQCIRGCNTYAGQGPGTDHNGTLGGRPNHLAIGETDALRFLDPSRDQHTRSLAIGFMA